MAKHHPDLVMCRKQPGVAIGRLCEKDDGKCVICDSYVRPCTLVRICDECNYGSYQGRCVICGGPGISDAYYCRECTQLEKDRDGCPKIVNLGSSKTDLFYERKKYGLRNAERAAPHGRRRSGRDTRASVFDGVSLYSVESSAMLVSCCYVSPPIIQVATSAKKQIPNHHHHDEVKEPRRLVARSLRSMVLLAG
ncbi:PHF5-like [Phytophthora cactorum]|nr:PHF5-like [Phytophthora cactorum]